MGGSIAAIDQSEQDQGYDPGPPPQDVDAPERVEEQNQSNEDNGQAEQESERPPPEGDKPEGEGEKDSGEGQESSGQPPDPPDPPDPDDPYPNPDEEEDEGEEEEEEDQEEGEEGSHNDCEEEEEKEVDETVEVVESESTKKKRKIAQRKEKVDEAAMTRLPFALSEKGPLYKGVMVTLKDKPNVSAQWGVRKGSISQAKDNTPIDHNGNRAFENIRDHQISSIFTLQKHLADCNKGNRVKNSTPPPLRANTGEYSPCKTEMTTVQTDDGSWYYEYSELPGLVPMKYGMKSFDIIEQIPFNLTPKGPHKNLVRQIVDEMGIEVKEKKVNNKVSQSIDDLPTALNPEAVRAARVLMYDVSNHQYDGSINRGLEYHTTILNRNGVEPVSRVDATGDWIHLASLVEMIKGVKQHAIDTMPFYLRGLVRMVPFNHLHHILLYAALTDLNTNIQIGIDSSAYVWVRAVQFHGELHQHQDSEGKVIPFHHDGSLYKDKPIITALFSYTEVMEAFATQDPKAYKYESSENFLMPLDRYPAAYPTGDVYPKSGQVLALRIRVQTAQQFGVIVLPSMNGMIITSGVPVKSVVGALDHKGRILDVLSLPTLRWEVAESPREQYPCARGLCYLPSLEVFHAYRVITERTDGAQILMNLPAYEPSKHKDLRAQRAYDATGVHSDMMYCEFKGCSIMVYGKMIKPPIGSNRFPGWETTARPARFDPSNQPKGKGKGKGKSKSNTPKPTTKAKGTGKGKGKKSDRDETQSREDKSSKPDPKGPNVAPQTWKDEDYEQEACPSDHHVAAYVQGTSEIPTFRVSWITSMGVMQRPTQVSPNKFGDPKLWKTPDQDEEFWSPCKHDQHYLTLTPGDEDCCRMCPNTDAEELIPCAWCNSWAHYRCTYAVGPGRACASHFKVLYPLDKIVAARIDDPVVPSQQHNKQVFPNCCYPRMYGHGKPSPSNVHYTSEAIWVYKHAWRGAGAYYRRGDHLQKKKTGNTPVEFKALRMFPEWERWIAPKHIFEHYKEGFQPNTLPHVPGVIQAFKAYRERSKLNPSTGNLWGCFWDSCSTKEKGFWGPLDTMQGIP